MQSLPLTFFTGLNYHLSNFDYTSTMFLSIRITFQQISIFFSVILIFAILYQWFNFFSYNPNKHLSRKNATLLHFSVMYFPLIALPILGYIFGLNIVCNSDSRFVTDSGFYISITIVTCTLLLMINHSVYNYFLKYSLSLRKGYFSYWTPPFNSIDLMYFYIVGIFSTFRSGPLSKYVTISVVLGLAYGIFSLIKFKFCTFIFATGRFISAKLALDSIVCSLVAIISIWAEINFANISIFAFILYLVTSAIAILLLTPGTKVAPANLSVNGGRGFNANKIRSQEEALYIIRTGLTFSVAGVTDREFLQHILLNHFSPALIPDILRICIYVRIPINSLYIPKVVLSSFDIIPLKYTTFQYFLYEHMTQEENNSSVFYIYQYLEHHYFRAEELLETFWTENDVKQLNLYQLGQAILEISNDFSKFGSVYKKNQLISDLWKNYAINVLAKPSAQKVERNVLNKFVFPAKGIYSFLLGSTTPIKNKKTQKSELEIYFRSYQNSNIWPLLGLFVFTTIGVIAVAIYFGIDSSIQTKNSWTTYIQNANTMQYSITLMSSILTQLDTQTVYPLTETISEILGISLDDARLFRSQKIAQADYGIDLIDILHQIPSLRQVSDSPFNCPIISYSLLASYAMPEAATFENKVCYFFSTLFFCEQMNIITHDNIQAYSKSIDWNSFILTKEIILFVFMGFAIILFVIFYYAFDWRMHNIYLNTVAYLSCSGSNKNFTERVDFSFTFTAQFMNYIAILLCLIFMFFGHYGPINTFKHQIDNLANITYNLCVVAVRIEEIMAMILLNSNEDGESFIPQRYIKFYCSDLDHVVNNLTHSEIPDVFLSSPPLDRWIVRSDSNDTMPFNMLFNDWSYYASLTSSNVSKESFRFLYLRQVYLQNFSGLITNAIPDLLNNIYNEIQQGSFTDLYISNIGMLLSLLLMSIYVWMYKRKKIWYYGASLILRRRIMKDQKFIVITRQILENKLPRMIDLLPFAAVIEDKNGIIVDTNWRVQNFTPFTANQLIGQSTDEIFAVENLGDVEIKRFTSKFSKHTLLALKDTSGISTLKAAERTLLDRFKPTFEISNLSTSIYIEIRFDTSHFKPENVFGLIDIIETHNPDGEQSRRSSSIKISSFKSSKYHSSNKNNMIISRISCGATFYRGIINQENTTVPPIDIIKSIFDIAEGHVIIAATYGKVDCFSISDIDGIGIVPAGIPVKRAHEIIVYGLFGRAYVDFPISETTNDENSSIPEWLIEISPLDESSF